MTKDIFEYIKILLPRHKCVTLPGFGAFILNKEENSAFDVSRGIVPPSYSITFNSRLQHDDGTLSSYIQSINNTSYEKASKDLAILIRGMRAELLVKKEIQCSTLGKIELIESTILFTQNKDYIFPTHFGLTPVSMPCISSISQILEKETKTVNIKRRLIVVAASAVVILLLAFPSTSITDNLVSNNQQAGYLSSLVTKEATVVEIEKETEVVEQAIIEEIDTKTVVSPTPTPIQHKSERTYYLIIGGESSPDRAERTLNRFKQEGFESAQILESTQRYRIYIKTYNNISEAERAVVQFRKNNPKYESAWIHSRRN